MADRRRRTAHLRPSRHPHRGQVARAHRRPPRVLRKPARSARRRVHMATHRGELAPCARRQQRSTTPDDPSNLTLQTHHPLTRLPRRSPCGYRCPATTVAGARHKRSGHDLDHALAIQLPDTPWLRPRARSRRPVVGYALVVGFRTRAGSLQPTQTHDDPAHAEPTDLCSFPKPRALGHRQRPCAPRSTTHAMSQRPRLRMSLPQAAHGTIPAPPLGERTTGSADPAAATTATTTGNGVRSTSPASACTAPQIARIRAGLGAWASQRCSNPHNADRGT